MYMQCQIIYKNISFQQLGEFGTLPLCLYSYNIRNYKIVKQNNYTEISESKSHDNTNTL